MKATGEKKGFRRLAIGIAIGAGVHLALLFLMAILAVNGILPETWLTRGVWVAAALASFAAAKYAAGAFSRELPGAMASAGGLWCLVAAVAVLAGGAAPKCLAELTLPILLGGAVSLLIHRKKKPAGGKRRHPAYRVKKST